ncbi:hypothetical protein [Sphingopyxis flava]|uniref:Uncharacterized protein n=1 Tax=Sphingopyxis flava TaxID=1507287 RepID=A0A1T5ABY7_9SPHN|nr:hypothetical protein [Sphingopyxis flava]SKB32440.1 hypothetical protein SAMN06295937_100379 [Sphingopyxis flava]
MSAPLTWRVVEAKATQRIEELRDQLEKATGEAVPMLQGQIAGLRYILTLDRTVTQSGNMIGDTPED